MSPRPVAPSVAPRADAAALAPVPRSPLGLPGPGTEPAGGPGDTGTGADGVCAVGLGSPFGEGWDTWAI